MWSAERGYNLTAPVKERGAHRIVLSPSACKRNTINSGHKMNNSCDKSRAGRLSRCQRPFDAPPKSFEQAVLKIWLFQVVQCEFESVHASNTPGHIEQCAASTALLTCGPSGATRTRVTWRVLVGHARITQSTSARNPGIGKNMICLNCSAAHEARTITTFFHNQA